MLSTSGSWSGREGELRFWDKRARATFVSASSVRVCACVRAPCRRRARVRGRGSSGGALVSLRHHEWRWRRFLFRARGHSGPRVVSSSRGPGPRRTTRRKLSVVAAAQCSCSRSPRPITAADVVFVVVVPPELDSLDECSQRGSRRTTAMHSFLFPFTAPPAMFV